MELRASGWQIENGLLKHCGNHHLGNTQAKNTGIDRTKRGHGQSGTDPKWRQVSHAWWTHVKAVKQPSISTLFRTKTCSTYRLVVFIGIIDPLTDTLIWQNGETLCQCPDATLKKIVELLEGSIFCYLGVPEWIHTNQGFCLSRGCWLNWVPFREWGWATPQANRVVRKGDWVLGDTLRMMRL